MSVKDCEGQYARRQAWRESDTEIDEGNERERMCASRTEDKERLDKGNEIKSRAEK